MTAQPPPPTGYRGPGYRQTVPATRSRLAAAAFTLFAHQGYAATRVHEIAAAAQLSTPTFYAYFPNKAHVVLPDLNTGWAALVLEQTTPEMALSERLRLGARRLLIECLAADEAGLLRTWELIDSVPELRRRALERDHAGARLLIEHLNIDPAGTTGGAQAVVVTACMATVSASLLRWAQAGGTDPLVDTVDEAWLALRSIGSPWATLTSTCADV